jgi:hypothetical protein
MKFTFEKALAFVMKENNLLLPMLLEKPYWQ